MIGYYKIVWFQKAITDVDKIYLHFKEKLQEPRYASEVVETIIEKVSSLSLFPNGNPKSRYHRSGTIRYVCAGRYLVFYDVNEEAKEVYILKILFSKRNVKNLLN